MSFIANLKAIWFDFLSSVAFLTRFPVPSQPYRADSLSRAVKFFPFGRTHSWRWSGIVECFA